MPNGTASPKLPISSGRMKPSTRFIVLVSVAVVTIGAGNSRVFEVVFPGNPGHAYLANSNGLAENVLVTPHVAGFKNVARRVDLGQQDAVGLERADDELDVFSFFRVCATRSTS